MWEYPFRVKKVIDGHTLEAEVDLGFRIWSIQRVRLLGVNVPELRARGGAEAAAFTRSWLETHTLCGDPLKPFILRTERPDHFGYWLGTVRCPKGHELNTDLKAYLGG
jgi:hypothetical protein